MSKLKNKKVLFISTDGFEESELFSPWELLMNEGAEVMLASPNSNAIQGVVYDDATGHSNVSQKTIKPDLITSEVNISEFDALVLPGGVVNPDALRINKDVISLIQAFTYADKPVAAICHAPWLLIEADVVRGRRSTGWFSVRTDLKNAGSEVVDAPVVVDANIITSRMPADIPAFTDAIIHSLSA